MLLGCDLNSRYTKDMKNNMEARMYVHTHIVLARVQYNENRPAHLVLYTRGKQLKATCGLAQPGHLFCRGQCGILGRLRLFSLGPLLVDGVYVCLYVALTLC